MKRVKNIVIYLVLMIIIVAITIGGFLFLEILQEMIFVNGEYIMWIFKWPYNRLVFIFEIYLMIFFVSKINKLNFDKDTKKASIWASNKIKRFKGIFLVLNIILLYVMIVNVTVIKRENIIDYSVLKPLGKEYSYKDISKIETGIYGSNIPFVREKGEFYYYLEFNDGHKINLNNILGGTYNELDTYEEIEIIDRELVLLGIDKESSRDNIDYCDLAQTYVDRFERIINNK